MKPEDIDKLFKERLGPSAPTPPADLWGRLQERMADEMPAAEKQESKPRGFMYLSYSVAAAIVLLLAVGIVFFNVQRGDVPAGGGIAHQPTAVVEQPLATPQQGVAESGSGQGMAQATEQGKVIGPESGIAADVQAPVAVQPGATAPLKAAIAKAGSTSEPRASRTAQDAIVTKPATQLVAKVDQPAAPATPQKGDYYSTGETVPATFAANTVNMNAQPVEIIIKRAVYEEPLAEEEPELSGFEKKQKLAKNIFKQVRNLSNGEKVELSELGINANSIALETQIGKQKISKVIQL
jgi:hypothetical protein